MLRKVLLSITIASMLSSPRAFADAVPPPPLFCLPGEVGVTSHRGPACVPKAPTDCAPGYRGELGGSCVLDPCESDKECKAGRRCLHVDACQELRELKWTGWGWTAQELGGSSRRDPSQPQPAGPPPKAWVKLRICGQDGPCDAPAACRPMGLCYPSEGDSKARVVGAAPSAEVLPPGVDSETLIARPPTSGSGCHRGCMVSSTSSLASWLAVPFLIATTFWRRRRRA